jgi:hypothetical protein
VSVRSSVAAGQHGLLQHPVTGRTLREGLALAAIGEPATTEATAVSRWTRVADRTRNP